MPGGWPPKKAAVADASRPESPIERLAPVQAPDASVRGAVARHPLRRPIAKPEPIVDDEAKGAVEAQSGDVEVYCFLAGR